MTKNDVRTFVLALDGLTLPVPLDGHERPSEITNGFRGEVLNRGAEWHVTDAVVEFLRDRFGVSWADEEHMTEEAQQARWGVVRFLAGGLDEHEDIRAELEAKAEADATAELQQERIAAGRDKETLRQWKAFQRERGQARAADHADMPGVHRWTRIPATTKSLRWARYRSRRPSSRTSVSEQCLSTSRAEKKRSAAPITVK